MLRGSTTTAEALPYPGTGTGQGRPGRAASAVGASHGKAAVLPRSRSAGPTPAVESALRLEPDAIDAAFERAPGRGDGGGRSSDRRPIRDRSALGHQAQGRGRAARFHSVGTRGRSPGGGARGRTLRTRGRARSQGSVMSPPGNDERRSGRHEKIRPEKYGGRPRPHARDAVPSLLCDVGWDPRGGLREDHRGRWYLSGRRREAETPLRPGVSSQRRRAGAASAGGTAGALVVDALAARPRSRGSTHRSPQARSSRVAGASPRPISVRE